jgi:hypothetical protein
MDASAILPFHGLWCSLFFDPRQRRSSLDYEYLSRHESEDRAMHDYLETNHSMNRSPFVIRLPVDPWTMPMNQSKTRSTIEDGTFTQETFFCRWLTEYMVAVAQDAT